MQQKLQVALEAIRSDNGFSETFNDERNQAVTALEAGVKLLRDNTTIHIQYFKSFIIDPLVTSIGRLKDNTAGAAAAVAKGAAIKWLADHLGQNLPDWLRGLF